MSKGSDPNRVVGGVSGGTATIGIALLSKALQAKVWKLKNLTNNKTISGQFPASRVERTAGSNWTQIQALNRHRAFLQFLNGKTPTLAVSSMWFAHSLLGKKPVDRIEELIKWSEIDPKLRRPPLLNFSLGDGLGLNKDVILTDVSDIQYNMPNGLGGIRQVTFTMNFMLADRAMLKAADQGRADAEVVDTRYAFARESDYFERMAQDEYGDPMMGVIIRQRHPAIPLLNIGDVVALPALEGVRSEIPTQTSIPLKGAFGKKDTATRRRRIDAFAAKMVQKNVVNFSTPKSLIHNLGSTGLFDYTFDQTFQ